MTELKGGLRNSAGNERNTNRWSWEPDLKPPARETATMLSAGANSVARAGQLVGLGAGCLMAAYLIPGTAIGTGVFFAGTGLLSLAAILHFFERRRNRADEAYSAFSRIDDLIERMGGITRQLKSYARKGQEAFSPVNMGDALASSLSMMEPQLKSRKVKIAKILPQDPVLVMGDRMRIEQVMVNLLRNALDATKTVSDPQLEIILASGETATLAIRDNGHGIEDLDALFEPFYTTKQPGDGVGLGLAISSGIEIGRASCRERV